MNHSESISARRALSGGGSFFLTHEDYPGYYISVSGQVFSFRSGKYLKPIRVGNYLGLTIPHRTHGLVKRYIHRLIAEFMFHSIPQDMHVCHNDGNRHNNNIFNIRIDTPAGNNADKRAHGTVAIGEKNPMARLTWEAVTEIRVKAASGVPQINLSREYRVSPMTISRAVRGESWRK